MTWRGRGLWQLVTVAGTALLLVVLRLLEPGFWLVNDKRGQYLPVYMDIGRRLRAGEWLPTIDPNLGTGGNYALDIQYGLFEPTHWVAAVGLSHFHDVAVAGFVWALVFLCIFAWGTTCLALRLGLPGPWAAACGLAAATSGYVFFWLAPNWIPGLVSLAWLPWLWWAWLGLRDGPGDGLRIRDCAGIAIFSYLVIAGGWPSTWLMFCALMLGLLLETVVRPSRPPAMRQWLLPLSLRAASALAGVVCAGLTVLPLARASAYTVRGMGISNDNFLVANGVDIMSFAAPQLHGDLDTFGHQTSVQLPIYFAVWFGVVVLWLVRWRRGLFASRGVITTFVATVAMLLLTQLPSAFGPMRDPFRQLAGAQFFFAVLVCVVACAAPLVVTRGRLAGIAASLGAMAYLSWARDPGLHWPSAAVVVVGVFAAALVLAYRVIGLKAMGVAALVGTFLLSGMAFRLNDFKSTADAQIDRTVLTPSRLHIDAADRPALALYPAGNPALWLEWFDDGVGRGFMRLSASNRIAPGYSSIRQRAYNDTFCTVTSHGTTCPDALRALTAIEPLTQKSWLDLLGYRTLLISPRQHRLTLWHQVEPAGWKRVGKGLGFREYRRLGPDAVAGRVTAVIGAARLTALSLSNETQTYDVSSAAGATLIFRDLYWPGYQATLNGRHVRITAFHKMLVAVHVPPGAHGRLELTYQPLSTRPLVALPVLSVVLLALAMLGAWRGRGALGGAPGDAPEEPGSAGVDGEPHADEPEDREPLQDPV